MEYILSTNIKKEIEGSSYGHCRCCLEAGNHRDITKVYIENSVKEVYADIFLDCFNVFLSTNTNLSTLICTNCVSMLRQAKNFKAMVLHTESQLTNALNDCTGDQMVLVNVPVAKDSLDTTIGFQIQVCNFAPPGKSTQRNIVKSELKTTEVLKHKIDNVGPVESNADTLSTSESNQISLIKHLLVESNIQKRALLLNTYQLLIHSNCTLFKAKSYAGFRCFCCNEIFEDFSNLREHYHSEHVNHSGIIGALRLYTVESLVVYADVTDLKCTQCDSSMVTLKEFKSHLVNVHDMKFRKHVTDRVVPLKVLGATTFECTICSASYENFGSICLHMNTHIRNYVCDDCGSGFVTILRLKYHIYTRHKVGTFLCDYCDKVFNTKSKLKVHVDFVHKMKKNLKCKKCPERFSDYFVQKKHMADVHGEQPVVYRCRVCNKVFSRRYTLSCHMKRHLNLKDVCCDVCSYTCYSKSELKAHKVKHFKSTDASFVCSICDKLFVSKKSLKVHMKTHFVEKRYKCDVCDESFEYRKSLTTHKETHDTNDLDVMKNNRCNFCDELYKDINDLKAHLKEHSDILGIYK